TDPIRQLILERVDSGVLQSAAIKAGMIPMRDDGFVKAAQGRTAIEEVMRVTQLSAA
ncbi:MAG: type II secretory ATPase GspE/PulE/Tfp pilus assembly ATPase PilB-like protein, partial [Gammaproteobacteria bacterium]